jgi:hypothetical protein
MAQKAIKRYSPSAKDIENVRISNRNHIAFSMSKASDNEDQYYVEKYDPRTYNSRSYVKKDMSMPQNFINRKKFTFEKAEKAIFEFYAKTADKLNKVIIEEKEIAQKKIYEKFYGVQVDLLDSIKEVELENKVKND